MALMDSSIIFNSCRHHVPVVRSEVAAYEKVYCLSCEEKNEAKAGSLILMLAFNHYERFRSGERNPMFA